MFGFTTSVENAGRTAEINFRELREPAVTPTPKIAHLFLGSIFPISVITPNIEFLSRNDDLERLSRIGLECTRFAGDICVVQGDMQGFTKMGEQVTKANVGRGLLGSGGTTMINQMIVLREQGANIAPIVQATKQVFDDIETNTQLVERAENIGVKRVREVAEMMTRVNIEVLALNESRKTRGLSSIKIVDSNGVVLSIEESLKVASEGDLLRYVCPDAECGAEVALVYGQVLSSEIEERKLKLSFRISVTRLGKDHIDVYTDPKTKKVWTSTGPGITKCALAEERTTPGRISLAPDVVEKLKARKVRFKSGKKKPIPMPYTNVGKDGVFEIDPLGERSLLTTDERLRFKQVNALPIPVAYCKLQIPNNGLYDLNHVLPNLQIMAERYGLKWIKPNTTPEKGGHLYVSFISTAEGKTPMTTIVEGLQRLARDCWEVEWNGVFAISYGSACLLKDEKGEVVDIISPAANRVARENSAQEMPNRNIMLSLDPMAKAELSIEDQKVLRGSDFDAKAKGIGVIECTAYGYSEPIIHSLDVMRKINEAAMDFPISLSVTELIYQEMEEKGYNAIDVQKIVDTVLLYSGIKVVDDENEDLSEIRDDALFEAEMSYEDQLMIRDVKYLTRIVLSYLNDVEKGKLPPVSSILNTLSLHVYHLDYIRELMKDLDDEEIHALILLSTTSLGRYFAMNFNTPFDAFDIDHKIMKSLLEKKLIYILQKEYETPKLVVRPGVSQLCDSACEPRLRESAHNQVAKVLLDRINLHGTPDNEWYKGARILLLHMMNSDIDELIDLELMADLEAETDAEALTLERPDNRRTDPENDTVLDGESRTKLIRVIKSALKFAIDKRMYTDLLLFTEAFTPIYKDDIATQLELKLNYGLSQFSMENLDESIEIFEQIYTQIQEDLHPVIDSGGTIKNAVLIEQIFARADLYSTIAKLKRNHIFFPRREEMVAKLRESFIGNPLVERDQARIYQFLKDFGGGLIGDEKNHYRQRIGRVKYR